MAGWQDRILTNHDWQTFDKAAPDPIGEARKKVAADIEKTLAALEKNETPRGMKVKESPDGKGKAIGLKLKAGNKLIRLGGHDEVPVPLSEAPIVLKDIKKDLEAKKLDEDIEKLLGSSGKASSSGGGKAGWSPERRAKFAKTMAARKAAKAEEAASG